jgi:hypothetical protein
MRQLSREGALRSGWALPLQYGTHHFRLFSEEGKPLPKADY